MTLLFLKIEPEEAVAKILDMILGGYQLKDLVNREHEQAKVSGEAAIINIVPSWRERYDVWVNDCFSVLITVYESEVYAYNFRDANSLNAVRLSGNQTRSNVVLGIQCRIEKLNEYEKFIRGHIPIEINAGRDVYVINGDKSNVKTKN